MKTFLKILGFLKNNPESVKAVIAVVATVVETFSKFTETTKDDEFAEHLLDLAKKIN